MRSESSSIRLLPVEVQAQIKSSVAITSLNDVVIGLLENALDAGATTVEIRVDYVKGYCSIVDNGFGIAAEDLGITGQLGVLHCTSKLDSSGPTYGKYGEFLFHLAALSILVITSRQKSAQAERSITFHRANPIAWSLSQEPQSEVLHNQQGTKVVVGNLFGDLPVRFKHNASRFENVSTAEMEFKALKRRVVSLLLASGRDLDLKLTEARTKQKYAHYHKPNDQAVFEIEKICSILQHAGYIAYSDVGSWRAASARTGTVQIRAAMSLIPAPSQHVQFISVGHHPLRSSHRASLFYDEINSIFELSTFGTEEAGLDVSDGEIERRKLDRPFKKDPNTIRRLNGQKKGVDRWPMFCVRIEFKTNETSSVLEETQDESIAADQWIEKVRGLMRSMIFEFLSTHNFYPRASRGKRPRQSNLDLRAIHKPAIQPEIHSETRSEPGLYQAMTQPAVDNRTFRNWSRIKVGKQNTFSDLTFDLPMSKSQSSSSALSTISGPQSQLAKVKLAQTALGQLELQSLSDADIMMLLEDLSNDNDCRNGSISCSIGPDVGQMNHIQGDYLGFVPSTGTTGPAALAEDTLLWTNPSNGHDVRLNARTGFIVPNFGDSYTEPGVTSGSISSLAWRPHSAPAASRPAYKERSLTIKRSRDLLIRSILDNDLVNTFRKLEEPIPSINMTEPDEATYLHVNRKPMYSCGHTDKQLSDYFTDPTTSFELKLSKANIEGAEVLAQVDQKFVLLRAQITDHAAEGEDVLILVDQHAADERIKVEELYRKLCTVSRVSLMKPIVFEVSDVELALFEARKGHFLEWGIIYDHRMVSSSSSLQSSSLAVPYLPAIAGQVVVRVLPELIVERCRLEPKVLIDLLRREIWFDKEKQPLAIEGSNENSWISKLPRCPQGLLEMITSRACRSAVMFNDILSPEQCEALIRRLAMCAFPFQCAHGRPTMVVLPKLGQTGNWDQTRRDRRGPFGQVFKEWQDSGRELNLV